MDWQSTIWLYAETAWTKAHCCGRAMRSGSRGQAAAMPQRCRSEAAAKPQPRGVTLSRMSDDCLFCKMASGAMDVPKLHDDDLVFAIKDINPRAPTHLLVIPKEHIIDSREVRAEHGPTVARMFVAATTVMETLGLASRGFRIAFNVGEDAGMTVPHLHMHVLGGRRLGAEG